MHCKNRILQQPYVKNFFNWYGQWRESLCVVTHTKYHCGMIAVFLNIFHCVIKFAGPSFVYYKFSCWKLFMLFGIIDVNFTDRFSNINASIMHDFMCCTYQFGVTKKVYRNHSVLYIKKNTLYNNYT